MEEFVNLTRLATSSSGADWSPFDGSVLPHREIALKDPFGQLVHTQNAHFDLKEFLQKAGELKTQAPLLFHSSPGLNTEKVTSLCVAESILGNLRNFFTKTSKKVKGEPIAERPPYKEGKAFMVRNDQIQVIAKLMEPKLTWPQFCHFYSLLPNHELFQVSYKGIVMVKPNPQFSRVVEI